MIQSTNSASMHASAMDYTLKLGSSSVFSLTLCFWPVWTLRDLLVSSVKFNCFRC
ncbi:hypothetical protein BKA62DRAFT_639437, partial [Auriculariales sp. MPI-PUGE-AT-0066]